MYKLFTLAATVAIMPLSEKIIPSVLSTDNSITPPAFVFHFKNNATINPFEAKKKTAEAWSQNWLATAQEDIRKGEYNFKWEEKPKAYCTPNRKNNLRFYYNDNGFSVEPRTTRIPIGDFDPVKAPGEIKYRFTPKWKVRFDLDKNQVGKGNWKISGNKAEYITNNITIQYLNNDEGMRQNFIVHSLQLKEEEITIKLRIKTKLKVVSHNNRLQFLYKKNTVFNYEDLKVWDANGKALGAAIVKNSGKDYFIKVNTTGAAYPITIDPLSTTPARILESNQANAYFGISVASAGDTNADGYSDVIVGAHQYDNGEADEGAAFVYKGSAIGIVSFAPAILQCDQAFARMGYSVASAGDVNGDGYSDVVVGANRFDDGETDEGAVFVYHGSASGIITTPATTLESNQNLAEMGYSVASAGDINGDGYSDVIVGTPSYDNGEVDEGMVTVYLGSVTGISAVPHASLEANQVNAYLGNSVASAGDINGDGYSDIFIGAYGYDNGELNEGIAMIYYGSSAGLNITPAAVLESDQENAFFGVSVACAGDLNGDGYSDVVVGANLYDNGETDEGGAFVYYGSAAGVSTVASVSLESDQVNANMGQSAVSAGDVNGDGYGDLAVGAFYYNNGQPSEGVVFIYQGSASGITAIPATLLENNQAHGHFGRCVASAGDVNGDGYSDLIVGSHLYDNGQSDEGGGLIYHGSAAGLSTTPNSIPDDADQAGANFGFSVASAGDVNGDGYGDVIIGAPQYDDGANAEEGRTFVYYGSATGIASSPNIVLDDANQSLAYFGWKVATAGDVNGDGYSDVIVGTPQYDDGANINEGRAFVYHGSATGLSSVPNSILDDADQAGANFGISVANAGDVNGDGYSDVIIGAYLFDDTFSNEGAAFVYHGSATGLSATPNSMPDDANQLNANFGISVSSAGDVNGDGYSDVIIGANHYNDAPNANEGRAFVYHGSASGLSATPNSTPDDADQPACNFGFSVSSAGDVNGDGYSDVIIGASSYFDGGNANEGRAFVYHGSATGLSATPDSTPDDADQANAIFGYSVASAGDVNGDGYSDVIIGAFQYDDGANTNEGRAFVYLGSSTGLSATPNSTPGDADQVNAFFGVSVAPAGDVNGDGYSDVVIGAYGYTDGANSGEGRAFIYNGNELTSNQRNNLRLYNADLTTPLNDNNFIFANFGAGLFAKSFLGRGKGKLVWETRRNYNPYSGTPITNSTFFTSQQLSYTDMGVAGIELKNVIDKLLGSRYTKLRARIKYDPVTAITGQVYSPWRNVSSIIDANNLGVLPIELISFNAAWQQKGRTARLDFKTDKESGICCFDIEKSTDGFNFTSIGSLPAKNISGIQSYQFTDNNASSNKQFYRIKIKGISGQIEYSNIQQLQNNGATEILVFPNPTNDALQLQLNGSYTKMDLQIINAAGQTVMQMNSLPVSNQSLRIPVNNLPAGHYWLKLQSGGEKQVLQFVKY